MLISLIRSSHNVYPHQCPMLQTYAYIRLFCVSLNTLKEKLITKPKFSGLFLEDAGKFATTEGRERQNRQKPVKDLKMLVEREGGEEGGPGIVRAAI